MKRKCLKWGCSSYLGVGVRDIRRADSGKEHTESLKA